MDLTSAEDARLLERVPLSLRAPNGIPEPDQATDLERATALASEALADLLVPGGVRTSPLGPGWSRDIDLYLLDWPDPSRLKALGWIPLDELLGRLGFPGRGRWGLVEDGRVLAGVDLHLGSPPDPIASLVGRCRRRSEVRVREVLEARVLLRSGRVLPKDDLVVRLAARAEAWLGGEDLARWKDGPDLMPPVRLPLPWHRQFRRRLASARSALQPRLVVAVSGVDGSGKSTLVQAVARNLDRAGVPISRVWARPGSIKIGLLDTLARAVKKLLRQDTSSWASAQVAKGQSAGDVSSRRGIVGWTWTMLVVISFLLNVRRQHIKGRGVILYDRHLLDALVHLDYIYEGVDLRAHRTILRRGLPKPQLSVYLDVSEEVALARKPLDAEDIYSGQYAVRRQLESYAAFRGELRNLCVLDGTRPADYLAAKVIRTIAQL